MSSSSFSILILGRDNAKEWEERKFSTDAEVLGVNLQSEEGPNFNLYIQKSTLTSNGHER